MLTLPGEEAQEKILAYGLYREPLRLRLVASPRGSQQREPRSLRLLALCASAERLIGQYNGNQSQRALKKRSEGAPQNRKIQRPTEKSIIGLQKNPSFDPSTFLAGTFPHRAEL